MSSSKKTVRFIGPFLLGVFAGFILISIIVLLPFVGTTYGILGTQYSDRISTLTTNLNTAQSTISTLNASLVDAEDTIDKLEDDKIMLQSSLSEIQTELTDAELRIGEIYAITITQHYEWDWSTWEWYWAFPIPIGLYIHYLEKDRPTDWQEWVDMITDTDDDLDDIYLDIMVEKMNNVSSTIGLSETEKVNLIISFVQSLPYTSDEVGTPWNEYPKYPIETLFNRGGDCEDTSLLTAILLDKMGYDVALLILEDDNHCAVGINIDAYGTYYEVDGKKYFFLETTGEGWQIGEKPDSLISTSVYVYPVD